MVCPAKLPDANLDPQPPTPRSTVEPLTADVRRFHLTVSKRFLDSSDPDYVPAHVRRAVWERDGGRWQHRLASGEICGSTRRLEIDHIEPRALGGPSTLENCRLACDAHNDRAARRVFGDAWMERYTRNPCAASPERA